MKEISIFIDESGDFGEYQTHSPYYIVSLVFHEQKDDISENVKFLNEKLSYHNLHNNCIHTGPIVRKEETYQNMDLKESMYIKGLPNGREGIHLRVPGNYPAFFFFFCP